MICTEFILDMLISVYFQAFSLFDVLFRSRLKFPKTCNIFRENYILTGDILLIMSILFLLHVYASFVCIKTAYPI